MEITKEKLFAMYLANENQKVLYRNEVICDLEEVSKWDDTCNIVNPEGNFLDCCNISDCQLILKPVSEMSEEDAKDLFVELQWDSSRTNAGIYIRDLINYDGFDDTDNLLNFKEAVIFVDFLRTHGYALSDEYFEKKWAVKERDVK